MRADSTALELQAACIDAQRALIKALPSQSRLKWL